MPFGCCLTRQREYQPQLHRRSSSCPPSEHFERIKEKEDRHATVQHSVFSFLEWAPESATACYNALHRYFPGALPGQAVHLRVKNILQKEKYGFTSENTLFGTSICPDEINNQTGHLADIMRNHWGEIFPLGGISGAPFVGATGFGAFSHHVPDDGNIIILFGPHVAISEEGEIGKYLREGQHHLSTACGAVIGAYHSCCHMQSAEDDTFNELDMQMGWIKTQLEPHATKISEQPNPMAALAYQAYEMVASKLERIVNTDFGNGRLVLVGGIQINMPGPFQDHFLPLRFDVLRKGQSAEDVLSEFSCALTQQEIVAASLAVEASKECRAPDAKSAAKRPFKRSSTFKDWEGVEEADFRHVEKSELDAKATQQHMVFAWLTWSPQPDTPCYRTLHQEFPGALPGPGVHNRVKKILTEDYKFTPENTLFGNSTCPDEINNTKDALTSLMTDFWGEVFPMGGIGGAPFAGKTGFKAFSHHVPDDGNIIILYGPHVAISEQGEVGKYLRLGQKHESTACGAIIGAYHACLATTDDEEFDETDMQMGWLKSQIMPHAERIQEQPCPIAALSYQALESVKTKMNKVVNTDFGSGRLVLIGGIQINLPEPCADHFLPMSFEVRQAGKAAEDIIEAFRCSGI